VREIHGSMNRGHTASKRKLPTTGLAPEGLTACCLPAKFAADAKGTPMAKRTSSKRELVERHKGDKRYVCRDPKGEFKRKSTLDGRWRPIGASMPKLRWQEARAIGAMSRSSLAGSASTVVSLPTPLNENVPMRIRSR